MKIFPLPLRLSVPVILLLSGGFFSLFSFQREIARSYTNAEVDAISQVKSTGDQTSGLLEYLFLFQQSNNSAGRLIFSKLGGNSNLELALLCDENNQIILSSRYELQNQLVSQTGNQRLLPNIVKVRQTMSRQVILSQDRQKIAAIYPVIIGASPDQIRPTKVGILLLRYDISAIKKRSLIDALTRSLQLNAVSGLLCLIVWIFFHKNLTLRVGKLVAATNRLAQGKLDVSCGLQGSDELTQIGAAFNQMASQIQADRQQLQRLATQRKDLLNLLASQIRHSLDLETILLTAVNEIRNLLNVDRCNFVWCNYDEQVPTASIVYEARSPDLPSVLGHYPIADRDSWYLEAFRSSKTTKIDDLTTDRSLDATARELLLQRGYLSQIASPVTTRSGKLGAISCVHCHNTHTWSEEEVELLQSVANQLAIAIDQAELYEQTRTAAIKATVQAEELQQTLQQLQKTQAILQATLDSTIDGILVVDRWGAIVNFNQKFIELWQLPPSLLALPDRVQVLKFMVEQLTEPEILIASLDRGSAQLSSYSHDLLKLKNGKIFELHCQPQIIENTTVGRVWSLRDITERSHSEAKIRYQASHDLLTGLPNRTTFQEHLSLALLTARQSQTMLCVMFMDLDRFKTINDTLGHDFGDFLLQEVAKRIKQCLRQSDTVARWGGDEFTILLPQIVNAQEAVNIAQRIQAAFKSAFDIKQHHLHISNSVGIALFPNDGDDGETLVKNADIALYRAKQEGRSNYQLYASTMNPQATELLDLENRLHLALEQGELEIYYQPQVNITTGKITRMEALLRWKHPELGLIPPGVFIPLAEENGLIIPIGEWVLKNACIQNKIWQDMGLPPLMVAVNLSARQFQLPNLSAIVQKTLANTGLAARFLELEITETTVMQNVEFTTKVLRELQQRGICIAMDDFGTGYSSLGYIKQFPLNTVKIDRSFIADLATDPYDRAIAEAVISLGKSLNLSIVAEGVETQEQLDCLQRLQCPEMQGYLFSRPLSVRDATALLQKPVSILS
jgi:diguanylate cyclase (GGDEF)-like protein/PAS domain S-box-containing protein